MKRKQFATNKILILSATSIILFSGILIITPKEKTKEISSAVMGSLQSQLTPNSSDLFSCGGRNDCSDDVDLAFNESQHKYTAQAYDKFGFPLSGVQYKWTQQDDEDIIKFRELDLVVPPGPEVDQSLITALESDQEIYVQPNENNIQNGKATVDVLGYIGTEEQGQTQSVDVDLYFCLNTWPSVTTFPFSDDNITASQFNPYTNFETFYCKDRGNINNPNDDYAALKVVERADKLLAGGTDDSYMCSGGGGTGLSCKASYYRSYGGGMWGNRDTLDINAQLLTSTIDYEDFESVAIPNLPLNWSQSSQISSSVDSTNAESYSGTQSALIHQDPNITYLYTTCDNATCTILSNCTWAGGNCVFSFFDGCEPDQTFNNGQALCGQYRYNRVNWARLVYQVKNLGWQPGNNYNISFYHKGDIDSNVSPRLGYSLGWGSQCYNKTSYYWNTTLWGDWNLGTDVNCSVANPSYGSECSAYVGGPNDRRFCCRLAPYGQTQCYSYLNMPTITPADVSATEWRKYSNTFTFTTAFDEMLRLNNPPPLVPSGSIGNRASLELGMSIGYNSTDADGANLYIDDFKVTEYQSLSWPMAIYNPTAVDMAMGAGGDLNILAIQDNDYSYYTDLAGWSAIDTLGSPASPYPFIQNWPADIMSPTSVGIYFDNAFVLHVFALKGNSYREWNGAAWGPLDVLSNIYEWPQDVQNPDSVSTGYDVVNNFRKFLAVKDGYYRKYYDYVAYTCDGATKLCIGGGPRDGKDCLTDNDCRWSDLKHLSKLEKLPEDLHYPEIVAMDWDGIGSQYFVINSCEHGSGICLLKEFLLIANPACDDGIDNDGDGNIDLADIDCTDPNDNSESGTCDDGVDNDNDGTIDYPDDFSCSSYSDIEEDGCVGTECCDNIDNDLDGLVDQEDAGCDDLADNTETNACVDGLDNDGDGIIDLADPGCIDSLDNDERGITQCDDGIDNDGDGISDYPADFGCDRPGDDQELNNGANQCNDGIDNDSDTFTDQDDLNCIDWMDNDETI